jgi:hypothetical protein
MSDRASLQRLLGDLDADCPLQNDVIKKQIVSLFDVVMDEQFAEITRLQAQVATLERIMEREAEKNTKALKPKVAGWQTDDKAGQP